MIVQQRARSKFSTTTLVISQYIAKSISLTLCSLGRSYFSESRLPQAEEDPGSAGNCQDRVTVAEQGLPQWIYFDAEHQRPAIRRSSREAWAPKEEQVLNEDWIESVRRRLYGESSHMKSTYSLLYTRRF